MDQREMECKKVKAIYWPDSATESGRHRSIEYGKCEMHLSVTYHGDHDLETTEFVEDEPNDQTTET